MIYNQDRFFEAITSGDFPRKIITICGSMTLYAEMLELAGEYTKRGHIVLIPFVNKSNEPIDPEILDKLHRDKIAISHEITVVIRNNYIGKSTRAQIEYAARIDRIIDYYEV